MADAGPGRLVALDLIRGADGSVRVILQQRDEGLLLGGSSGVNIAGAIRLAKDMGPGHTIVTPLCDSGGRYAAKMFNPEFLRSKNLPVPGWMERKSNIVPPYESR